MKKGRKPAEQLTPLELEIMSALWDGGPATVQTVQERHGGGLAYTTVQTMLNILVRKGKAKRTLVDRAFRYHAVVTRQHAVRQAVDDVLQRLFGGSAEALVMNLVERKQLTPETLRRLQAMAEEDSDD